MAKRIKFHASFPEPERFGLMKVTEVVFKLGLGPCGRFVESLTHKVEDGLLTITQTSHGTERPYPPYAGRDTFELAMANRPRWFGLVGNGVAYHYNMHVYESIRTAIKHWRDDTEIKEFVYKLSDIHGRIEALK